MVNNPLLWPGGSHMLDNRSHTCLKLDHRSGSRLAFHMLHIYIHLHMILRHSSGNCLLKRRADAY